MICRTGAIRSNSNKLKRWHDISFLCTVAFAHWSSRLFSLLLSCLFVCLYDITLFSFIKTTMKKGIIHSNTFTLHTLQNNWTWETLWCVSLLHKSVPFFLCFSVMCTHIVLDFINQANNFSVVCFKQPKLDFDLWSFCCFLAFDFWLISHQAWCTMDNGYSNESQ